MRLSAWQITSSILVDILTMYYYVHTYKNNFVLFLYEIKTQSFYVRMMHSMRAEASARKLKKKVSPRVIFARK